MTTRRQGLLNKDNLVLPKIKRLQENIKKIHKSTIADKILEFNITSQNPKKINMPVKHVEENIDNVKNNLKEHKMEYNIVENIRRAKANISLFEMCNVPQQKEKLLKELEVPEEKLPTDN